MQISYNWLSTYLPKPVEINYLSQILTSIGLEVEGIEKIEFIKGGLEGLVVGQVISCSQHPNADKLKVTTVDIGQTEFLSIVCGAPNVAAGQKVIVAPVQSTIYPLNGVPFTIKKAKIRGEESFGMICAEDEIGIGESHEGIIVLPDETPIGLFAKDYYKIPAPDYKIEIGLTPNRSDANSHIGVAKDVCAYLTYHENEFQQIQLPELKPLTKNQDLPFTIQIEDQQACKRYGGIIIANVEVKSSPEWLKERLKAIDIHPINNIVDITNFVLHEYGQPLHAFDYDQIKNHSIHIKKAKNEEKFIGLDGKERKLNADDLMICDAEKPLVIAGVFGGLESGVSESTQNIFLETAYFDPKTIRKTSMRHGLRTDAATHFEKGVNMDMVIPALHRAAQLILEIAGGQVASKIIDIYPQPFEPKKIELNFSYLNQLCGKEYAPEKVKAIFDALHFPIFKLTNSSITLSIPGEHTDIHQPADLVEEVLRIDGLDNITISDRIHIPLAIKKPLNHRAIKEKMANYLSSVGFSEIMTNSLSKSKYYTDYNDLVKPLNSISIELDTMRPSMLESGLEVILYNYNRKMQNLKFYELGKTYHQNALNVYEEKEWLSIWITGQATETNWNQPATESDLFYLKGTVAQIFNLLNIQHIKTEYDKDKIIWKKGKEILGTAFAVRDQKLKDFGIKQAVFYTELNLKVLAEAVYQAKEIRYKELPKFPSMKRDLALVVDKSTSYEKIESIALAHQWEALIQHELFDIFENEKLGKDKKSIALSFTFQLKDRTLTDLEVDKMMQELIRDYETEVNAFIRS